jgi:hypothetical protein
MSQEDYPKYMQHLEEIVQGIKSSKDWEMVADHMVGLALETLSHGQQLAVITLQQLYTEVQQYSKLSNN